MKRGGRRKGWEGREDEEGREEKDGLKGVTKEEGKRCWRRGEMLMREGRDWK